MGNLVEYFDDDVRDVDRIISIANEDYLSNIMVNFIITGTGSEFSGTQY